MVDPSYLSLGRYIFHLNTHFQLLQKMQQLKRLHILLNILYIILNKMTIFVKQIKMTGRIEVQLKIAELATKLEDGADVSTLMLEYMPKWNIAERTIRRYIALAKDIVAGRLKKREAVLEAIRGDTIIREAEEGLKSTLELEAKLCAIVDGLVEMEKVTSNKDGTDRITKRKPSVKEIIEAIDILLKLRGMYRPEDKRQADFMPVPIIVHSERDKQIVESIRKKPKRDEEDFF
jgi:hypothetical protein